MKRKTKRGDAVIDAHTDEEYIVLRASSVNGELWRCKQPYLRLIRTKDKKSVIISEVDFYRNFDISYKVSKDQEALREKIWIDKLSKHSKQAVISN